MKPLTDKQKVFCEYWLSSYRRIAANLTDERFNPSVIWGLILYEMSTRQRESVLDRLFARYYKLRKAEVVQRALDWMKKYDDPSLFMQTINQEDTKHDIY